MNDDIILTIDPKKFREDCEKAEDELMKILGLELSEFVKKLREKGKEKEDE